jgi:hypothetical protein
MITITPDTFNVIEDVSFSSAPISVLDNDDLGSGGGVLSIFSHTEPSNGSLSIQNDGTFVYTPLGNFVGNDSFQYTIKDNTGATATTSVSLIVSAAPPVINNGNDIIDTDDQTAVSFSVFAPGVITGGPIVVSSFTFPATGTLQFLGGNNFKFTPSESGIETFQYSVLDISSILVSSTVTINIEDTTYQQSLDEDLGVDDINDVKSIPLTPADEIDDAMSEAFDQYDDFVNSNPIAPPSITDISSQLSAFDSLKFTDQASNDVMKAQTNQVDNLMNIASADPLSILPDSSASNIIDTLQVGQEDLTAGLDSLNDLCNLANVQQTLGIEAGNTFKEASAALGGLPLFLSSITLLDSTINLGFEKTTTTTTRVFNQTFKQIAQGGLTIGGINVQDAVIKGIISGGSSALVKQITLYDTGNKVAILQGAHASMTLVVGLSADLLRAAVHVVGQSSSALLPGVVVPPPPETAVACSGLQTISQLNGSLSQIGQLRQSMQNTLLDDLKTDFGSEILNNSLKASLWKVANSTTSNPLDTILTDITAPVDFLSGPDFLSNTSPLFNFIPERSTFLSPDLLTCNLLGGIISGAGGLIPGGGGLLTIAGQVAAFASDPSFENGTALAFSALDSYLEAQTFGLINTDVINQGLTLAGAPTLDGIVNQVGESTGAKDVFNDYMQTIVPDVPVELFDIASTIGNFSSNPTSVVNREALASSSMGSYLQSQIGSPVDLNVINSTLATIGSPSPGALIETVTPQQTTSISFSNLSFNTDRFNATNKEALEDNDAYKNGYQTHLDYMDKINDGTEQIANAGSTLTRETRISDINRNVEKIILQKSFIVNESVS